MVSFLAGFVVGAVSLFVVAVVIGNRKELAHRERLARFDYQTSLDRRTRTERRRRLREIDAELDAMYQDAVERQTGQRWN